MIVILIKLFENYSLNFSYFVRNSDIKKASKLENIEGNIVVMSWAKFQVFESSLKKAEGGENQLFDWKKKKRERNIFFPFNIERRRCCCCYVAN